MICLWSKAVGDKPVVSQTLIGYIIVINTRPLVSCNNNDILWYNYNIYHDMKCNLCYFAKGMDTNTKFWHKHNNEVCL